MFIWGQEDDVSMLWSDRKTALRSNSNETKYGQDNVSLASDSTKLCYIRKRACLERCTPEIHQYGLYFNRWRWGHGE